MRWRASARSPAGDGADRPEQGSSAVAHARGVLGSMRRRRTHPAVRVVRIDPSRRQCFSHRGRTGSWGGQCWGRTTATGPLPSVSSGTAIRLSRARSRLIRVAELPSLPCVSAAIPPAPPTRGLIQAAVTSAALLATAAPRATAADDSRATARAAAASSATRFPQLTFGAAPVHRAGDEPGGAGRDREGLSRNSGFAFPIAAAATGAAAWCAKGALAGIPTSVLSDIAAGKASSKKPYVRYAVIGCCAARKLGHDVARADRTGPRFAP
ncbi:hypothetical protein STREPTOSP366_33550 [Streptomyces variabilis]